MKILFIVPGSGDAFYCGNCFRDNLHASSLRKAGHEVVVMPLYLPLDPDSFRADAPLFFPAISLYVSQKYYSRKAMPGWMEKILNSKRSLSMAASFSGSTSSRGLEDMTLAMINGRGSVFARHASAMVDWIRQQEQPDVVHLSSSLVIGIARMLKTEMDVPIVCSLQDEEIWINPLGIHAASAWQGIEDNLGYIDAFVASSEFYKAESLKRFPGIADRTEVVYPGLAPELYSSDSYPADPTLGFFYRMSESDGLHILAEAFVKVKRTGRIPQLRLRIGGGFSGADKSFLRRLRTILRPYRSDVTWLETYSLAEHAAFYRQTSAVCVPITFSEAVGLYVCESFAAGRPVIEPASGSFPEIVGGGGILYESNDSDCLARAILSLFTDRALWEKCRDEAVRLGRSRYSDAVQAQRLGGIYGKILKQAKQ
ncbi:MAG: glycosyltransferase family 4 protein [Tannerellaceae bacterium]|jgi:glycosyltransferase involved in cell wall biosynthesis|nr:glycosyltransferase family 4 protein [Tannerellaceae bacterium]